MCLIFVSLLAVPWMLLCVDVIAHTLRKWPLAILGFLWVIAISVMREILPEYFLLSIVIGFGFSAVTYVLLIYADRTWRQLSSWWL
jgi:hypothetical protein